MTKRLLDTTARELATYGRDEVLASIRASEGRVLAAEVIAPAMAAVHDVSNPEVAAAMGADLVVLNLLDVRHPAVHAVEVADAADVVREVKRLTGRLVAVNLEPVDPTPTASPTTASARATRRAAWRHRTTSLRRWGSASTPSC